MSRTSIAPASPWLRERRLQDLLGLLSSDGEEARIAGGAVRNALLGEPVADVDIATTALPEEVVRRVEAAGLKAVPTGIEHGTVTVVTEGHGYEVTTLRADVETDGRWAKVVFGRDWKLDAQRRDFTINALYADADGSVVDHVGGLTDLETRSIRFIGKAEQRIQEDYLRILRFFRFFARYGAGRPDAAGLKACTRLKDGLERLSAERIWAELRKLLAAPDPSRALLWMRQTSVLTKVLPESEKWGIDSVHGLIAAEHDLAWTADPMLRLVAIVPPDRARMEALAGRLRMSNSDASRLTDWAATAVPASDTNDLTFRKQLYRSNVPGLIDGLKLALAGARARARNDTPALVQAGGYARLLNLAAGWQKPVFPLKGADLLDLGMQEGPQLGSLLHQLETSWVDSGFALGRDALLQRAAQLSSKS